MFVRQSTYDKMCQRAIRAEMELATMTLAFEKLIKKWNALVKRINKLGGERYLESGETSGKNMPFTETELTKLIQLCHPDKHQGKPMATEMTQKLLQLREKM